MTVTAATPVSGFLAEWIRPWYPAGWTGHARSDCPDLLRRVADPQPGPGWLNPKSGITCEACFPSWDAKCETCGARLSADEFMNDLPHTETDAQRWQAEHECAPVVRLVPPPADPAPAVPDGQTELFPLTALFTSDLEDAAA